MPNEEEEASFLNPLRQSSEASAEDRQLAELLQPSVELTSAPVHAKTSEPPAQKSATFLEQFPQPAELIHAL